MLLQLYHLITNFSITESLSSGKIISVQKNTVSYIDSSRRANSRHWCKDVYNCRSCAGIWSRSICAVWNYLLHRYIIVAKTLAELQAFYFFHFIISILGIPPKNQEDFTSHTLCAYYHKKRIYIPAKIFVLHMPSLDKELQNTADHMLK